jgi:hypothetical protein
MRRERPDHTLQPTAVVPELFLLLLKQRQVSAETRAEFLAFAGHLMGRILVDYARTRHAGTRGGTSARLEVDSAVLGLAYARMLWRCWRSIRPSNDLPRSIQTRLESWSCDSSAA